MNDKLNNYHFGRHVFDYFPWYTYDNKNIDSTPILNDTIRKDFNFALGDFDSMIYVWNNTILQYRHQHREREQGANGNCISLKSSYFDSAMLFIENGIASYVGIKEQVNDWEDIEKIRLRNILGTREMAEAYIKIIDNYTKYHDLISDMVYTQIGEDIEISVVSLQDLIARDSEIYKHFIENEDIYKALHDYHLNNNFLNSVYSYYVKYQKLTANQIEAVKKSLQSKICSIVSAKKLSFFYVKTNRISNVNRITDYLTEINLKYKKFNNYLLVYT